MYLTIYPGKRERPGREFNRIECMYALAYYLAGTFILPHTTAASAGGLVLRPPLGGPQASILIECERLVAGQARFSDLPSVCAPLPSSVDCSCAVRSNTATLTSSSSRVRSTDRGPGQVNELLSGRLGLVVLKKEP
jgi:hypothetical protein